MPRGQRLSWASTGRTPGAQVVSERTELADVKEPAPCGCRQCSPPLYALVPPRTRSLPFFLALVGGGHVGHRACRGTWSLGLSSTRVDVSGVIHRPLFPFQWLNAEKTIQRLVGLIHPGEDEDVSRRSGPPSQEPLARAVGQRPLLLSEGQVSLSSDEDGGTLFSFL